MLDRPFSKIRILIIDDNPAIHDDIRRIISPQKAPSKSEELEEMLFGPSEHEKSEHPFDLTSAYQGREGFEMVKQAVLSDSPFAVAMVDIRMPPGWDGIETIQNLRQVDPTLQYIICTAYSDYSWKDMVAKLGITDNVLLIKKPFDIVELLQLFYALSKKWQLNQEVQKKIEDLEHLVKLRTKMLVEKELELAMAFQKALVDCTSQVLLDRLEISSYFKPAVGCAGDWCNHFQIDENRVLVLIGDVTGHGMAASMVSATVHGGVLSLIYDRGPSLEIGEVITTINEIVEATAQSRYYMTCIALIYDRRTPIVRFVNAGHCHPLFFCAKTNKVIPIMTQGTPLGMNQFTYSINEIQLDKNDVLVLFTDGIFEATDENEREFGMRRFRDTLARSGHLPAELIRNEIVLSFSNFIGEVPLKDDLTLSVLKILG